jgi:hypothetical protein
MLRTLYLWCVLLGSFMQFSLHADADDTNAYTAAVEEHLVKFKASCESDTTSRGAGNCECRVSMARDKLMEDPVGRYHEQYNQTGVVSVYVRDAAFFKGRCAKRSSGSTAMSQGASRAPK